MITRRTLLFAVGALALPRVSLAQRQAEKSRRIGWLEPSTPDSFAIRRKAFLEVLSSQGYVEGKNLVVETRYAHGRIETFPVLAAELVGLRPECVLAIGVDAIRALRRATSTIPIVMGTIDADPIKEGFAASLARPGGNVTGLVGIAWELAGKRLELLKEVAPKASRIAVIFDSRSPAGDAHLKETEIAARAMKMQIQLLGVKDAEELDGAFRAARKMHADALFVIAVGLINSHRQRITALAAESRLPAIYSNLEFVSDGGLMAYAPDGTEQFRRAAIFVDRILKGAKPGDLPIEQPTKFELVVNMKTAKSLGIKVPQSILIQASKVIE